MDKNKFAFLLLTVFFLASPNISFAYNLSLDVNQLGKVTYSYPTVLGDEDKPEDLKPENNTEQQKPERKETPQIEKPETVEIKEAENKIKVELRDQNHVEQQLSPENINLQFSSVPNTAPTQELEVKDIGNSRVGDTKEVLQERTLRKDEKVKIQSETHNDGTIETQLESRDVNAKIKNNEIELNIKNNNIGITDNQGKEINLVHLPDQAVQKFSDLGVTTNPDTLEVGLSGNNFEYTVTATKMQKLFGIFPRLINLQLSLNDSNGNIVQQKVAKNLEEQILNIFSF
ncbi:hypothetical protein M1116_01990 [Patescibacteria group bacterium]|nr:hypothetical protein [Patescibacteria group bacterium]